MTLTSITTPGLGNNDNEQLLHSFHSSRTEVSPADAI